MPSSYLLIGKSRRNKTIGKNHTKKIFIKLQIHTIIL